MAKIREREIREQQDARKYYLEVRYIIESEKKYSRKLRDIKEELDQMYKKGLTKLLKD